MIINIDIDSLSLEDYKKKSPLYINYINIHKLDKIIIYKFEFQTIYQSRIDIEYVVLYKKIDTNFE